MLFVGGKVVFWHIFVKVVVEQNEIRIRTAKTPSIPVPPPEDRVHRALITLRSRGHGLTGHDCHNHC